MPSTEPLLARVLARLFPDGPAPSYELTRFAVLRGIGACYLVAFAIACDQGPGLVGSRGILPAARFFEDLGARFPDRLSAFLALPTVFWLDTSDAALRAVSFLGLVLAAIAVAGGSSALLFLVLWACQLSLVAAGQDFWGFGWESLLLEAGFLAIFLGAPLSLSPFPPATPAPRAPLWLYRWLLFRLMLGAGLIKLRGDGCWWELTCLFHHYETQPNPHPLSPFLHFAPPFVHRAGVLVNHVVELGAPWFLLGPRTARHVAAVLTICFQILLVASGNLAFLNWLTIAVALACFDDRALAPLFPKAVERAARHAARPASRPRRVVSALLVALVAALSVRPVQNLLADEQAMNTSFDRLRLVNTYGAFGSVGKERLELVFEGTLDDEPGDDAWRAYELPCKPGDPLRAPCLVTPYHFRLDWQLWFVPLAGLEEEPWVFSFLGRLLAAEPDVLDLLAEDPFEGRPPRYVRVSLYRYRFAPPGEPSGAWWRRERLGTLLRPMSRDDPDLLAILDELGHAPP